MKDRKNQKRGQIVEKLPNLEYRIREGQCVTRAECNVGPGDTCATHEKVYRCYVSGKMRLAKIHPYIGQEVYFVFPQGSSVGRIEHMARVDGR